MTWEDVLAEAEAIAARTAADMAEDGRASLDVPFPRASYPGEFPRRRTGELRDSVTADIVKDGDNLTIHYRVNAPHARYLVASGRLLTEPIAEKWGEIFRDRLAAIFS